MMMTRLHPGGAGVDPSDRHVLARRQTVPEVIEGKGGDQLENEGSPFRGPTEDKNMNQRAGRFRTGKADGPPDADAGHGAEHQGDQDKVTRQSVEIGQRLRVVIAVSSAHQIGEQDAGADGELSDDDMGYRDQKRNEHRCWLDTVRTRPGNSIEIRAKDYSITIFLDPSGYRHGSGSFLSSRCDYLTSCGSLTQVGESSFAILLNDRYEKL